MDLQGKRALVTGASGGIGRAIAVELAAAGCHVAVHYAGNSEGAAEAARAVEAHDRHAVLAKANLAEPDAAEGLLEAVEADLGPLDVLVNCAGSIDEQGDGDRGEKPFAERLPEWDRILNVNLRAPFALSARLAPGMQERGEGSIVNVSSIGGWAAQTEVPLYSLSKSALLHATRLLALEFAPEVRVNAVAPGWVPTSFGWGHLQTEWFEEAISKRIPLGRMGTAEEVARVVRFLAGDASYTTGAVLTSDGGLGAKMR